MTEAQAWELIAAVESVHDVIFGAVLVLGAIWICERIGARRIAVDRKP